MKSHKLPDLDDRDRVAVSDDVRAAERDEVAADADRAAEQRDEAASEGEASVLDDRDRVPAGLLKDYQAPGTPPGTLREADGESGPARIVVTRYTASEFEVCEVTDPGEAKGDMFGAIPPDPDSEHGHGLWAARQLCDLLEIRTRQPGTTVRIHMRLSD